MFTHTAVNNEYTVFWWKTVSRRDKISVAKVTFNEPSEGGVVTEVLDDATLLPRSQRERLKGYIKDNIESPYYRKVYTMTFYAPVGSSLEDAVAFKRSLRVWMRSEGIDHFIESLEDKNERVRNFARNISLTRRPTQNWDDGDSQF